MVPDIYTYRACVCYKLIQAKQRKTFFSHKQKQHIISIYNKRKKGRSRELEAGKAEKIMEQIHGNYVKKKKVFLKIMIKIELH